MHTVIGQGAQEGCIEESGDGVASHYYPAIAQGILQLGPSGTLGAAFHSRSTPLPVVGVPRPASGNAFGAGLAAADDRP